MGSDSFEIANEDLNEMLGAVGVGVWVWDISAGFIQYDDEYLRMLGYARDELDGTLEEWQTICHPEDLLQAAQLLEAYIAGELPAYECEMRMKHRNGSYIWTRAVGKIVARGAQGNPTRLIGGYLDIDKIKRSEKRLTEALKELEHNHLHLESEMDNRTRELMEQDSMLWTVNRISRKLLAFQSGSDFEALVQKCLRLLGESIHKNRIYLWKDRTDERGMVYCAQIYEWVRGATSIQSGTRYEEISYEDLPAFAAAIGSDQCLNSLLRDLSESEKKILEPQGIKTILIAPVTINGKRWGFIGVDNCETEQLFTSMEENMLLMSGSMLANTIEKMETEAKLREMEERTQIMLNAMPLCCNLWTLDYQNMSCNDEAVRLFELSSQSEYLNRFNELSPEFQPCARRSDELAVEYIAKAFREGYCRFEWMHQKLDGTPVPAEITLVRIKYRDSFIVAGYTRDLREQKKMLAELRSKENDLRTARDEALLSSKAKSNFLANMSHEIRTPMNAISGLTEIILRESESEKTAEYAKGIKSASSNLLNIINDILDISKIESGKLEIYNAPYELASLINDVITICRMRLGEKPLMFITDIDSCLPAQLVGDEIRIKQILINLLSNAIKFTNEGYLSLRVSGTVEKNRVTLRFSVKDSGTGIKSEDVERLFAEFERVNTTKNRSIEGTGLGLAISKQLCEMMQGCIEVHSYYGQGSEFIVTLPQECPVYQRMAQVREKKSVLLYEPRERYRFSIAETLENLDCSCVPCANQSELYESILRMPYDYILTAALHLKKVRSIVEKHRLAALVAAFVDYGEKVEDDQTYTILFPVNCLQLANLLNGQHNNDFTRRGAEVVNFIAPSARVLVVDDNPVNLQVAKGLMEPYQFAIDTAENGMEAIEKVKSTCYDLVFMDHMMPEMDGIDATVAVRQMNGKYYQSLPIIALTANALVGTKEMFIREGMNDFLAKPIEIYKLVHMLTKWLPQSKIEYTLPKETVISATETPKWNITGVNTVQGILRVGGNEEHYHQILNAYYTDGRQKCTSLMRHITENDFLAFQTEIHALKSTSATIGALELSTMAARLEAAAQRGDVACVTEKINEFLTAFQEVLGAIRPVLSDELSMEKPSADAQTDGDLGMMAGLLGKLHDAAEIANISTIEAELNKLQAFMWSEEFTRELQMMQECVRMFDYDGVLECVTRMKTMVESSS